MQTIFSDYIDALRIIHPDDDFWILDNKFKTVYSNNCVESLDSLHIINENEVAYCLLDFLKMNSDNIKVFNDVVVFKNQIDSEQLLLLNLNQIVIDEEVIGYFIIVQGQLDDFEHLKLVNLLLNGGSNQLSPNVDADVGLEAREKEILYYISRGKSYREIADSLSDKYHKKIALSTIASIVRNSLYEKMGVYNMLDLKAKALELNIINHIPASLFSKD